MESLEAEHAVLRARDSATGAGRIRVQLRSIFPGRVKFFRAKKRRPRSMRGEAVWGRPLVGRIGGVDSVHTLGLGLGRTGAGLARIPYVLAGAQCFRGLESGSSPTSGTVFSLFRDLFGVFSCAHCAHSCL